MTNVDFFDLQNSLIMSDRLKFDLFVQILKTFFVVENITKNTTYRYSTQMETEENRTYLIDNWDALQIFGYHNEHYKKNKRLVQLIINRIVDHLNQTYQFTNPMTFTRVIIVKQAEYGSKKTITLTYFDLKLS